MPVVPQAVSNTAVIIKEWAGATILIATTLFGIMTWAGVGITIPLVTKAWADQISEKIDKQQKQLENVIQQTQDQSCTVLQLLKDRYDKDQHDAQEELNKNPGSMTLVRARDEASSKVAKINAKLNSPPCG